MNMDMKMNPVVREVTGAVNSDPDTTTAEEIKTAIKRWELNERETIYLCRYFKILTEDLK